MLKLPLGVEKDKLIDDLKELSWTASDIFEFYSKEIKIQGNKKNILKFKKNNEPVTEVDLQVNNLIIKGLSEKYPKITWKLLSEENYSDIYFNKDKKSKWSWVLDPLDGTKDFIQGSGSYAMQLALNYENKPVLGVVLIPHKDELWISNGDMTWGENKNGTCLKVNLSEKKNLEEMTIVTSKNHRNNHIEKLINQLKFKKSISMGSIGCKICSILKGESDIYIGISLPGGSSPKDWDYAAPEAILKSAGGAITNLENQDLSYNKVDHLQEGVIVASSCKKNHEDICFKIKKMIDTNIVF